MTTVAMCFSIDGEWLTEHCRSLWTCEGRPDHALKTLMGGLQGITKGQCLDILEGRMKLTGNSKDPDGLNFVPDNTTERNHDQDGEA